MSKVPPVPPIRARESGSTIEIVGSDGRRLFCSPDQADKLALDLQAAARSVRKRLQDGLRRCGTR